MENNAKLVKLNQILQIFIIQPYILKEYLKAKKNSDIAYTWQITSITLVKRNIGKCQCLSPWKKSPLKTGFEVIHSFCSCEALWGVSLNVLLVLTCIVIFDRSSRSELFSEKRVLKDFALFTGKHLCWSLFLIKLAEDLQPY